MTKQKAILLDRDGVLNREIGRYVWTLEDLEPEPQLADACQRLHRAGFLLIVITNQAGIGKGLYTRNEMHQMHAEIQRWCGGLIEQFYYCPHHPEADSDSLSRKPDTVNFMKAIVKYDLDPAQCWMVGDRVRDLIPARRLGMRTVWVKGSSPEFTPELSVNHLFEAVDTLVGEGL